MLALKRNLSTIVVLIAVSSSNTVLGKTFYDNVFGVVRSFADLYPEATRQIRGLLIDRLSGAEAHRFVEPVFEELLKDTSSPSLKRDCDLCKVGWLKWRRFHGARGRRE